MRIVVLGYLVPDEEIETLCLTDRMPPMQTHRFMKGLLQALESGKGTPPDLISVLPTNDYPHGPRLFVPARNWSSRRSGFWWGLPFVNVFGLKHATRYLSAFFALAFWSFSRRKERRCVLVVSAATPQLAAARLATRLFGGLFVSCLMDPPSVGLETDGGLKSRVRTFDRRIAQRELARADGFVTVAEPLARLFSETAPAYVFEGTAPELPDSPPAPREERRFVCAYAGALGAEYGLPTLLSAFRLLDHDRFVLWVFGKGDGEAEVRAAGRNVEHYGFLTSGLDERLKSADLLLAVRPSQGADSALVFPSKILYSMALGVPTGSTRLKAIPEAYFETLYALDDDSPETLARSIEEIAGIPVGERRARGERTRDFVQKQKSPSAVGLALREFIDGLHTG